jgi:hypothetical protein
MILDEESKLLGYLGTVTRDLERRICVRKERRKWRGWCMDEDRRNLILVVSRS